MALAFYKTVAVSKWRLEELDTLIDEFDSNLAGAVKKLELKELNDYQNLVLRVAGKSIVTFREILTLSAYGYPDGALSLARNLYEQFITLYFFGQHNQDQNLDEYVSDYFIDYDIQRYRALEYESQYCREDIECLKQDQSKLKRLKELANHQGKSGYWWTGKGSFRGVADEILKNENDPVIKKFLANLHLIYKRACLNVHACCFGNINRLGTPSGFVGVDTSPQLNGHELALYLATSSFIMVVGVTCRELKLDYEKFKENLNHLMLFYAKNMRSESNYV